MTGAMVRSAVCGVTAGLLMRPCCVIPAVLSMLGIGSAGASAVIATHRAEFLLASAALLVASSWITLRREGGWFNKALAIGGSAFTFVLSAGWMGVL